jgi:hypothetical protein
MGDAAFEALWKNVLDHWDQEQAHGAFLEHSQLTSQLAEAAARYRGMKGDRDRSVMAEKRLAGVAIVALAQLEAMRSNAPRSTRRIGSLLVATSFALAAAGLLAYLYFSR